MHEHRLGVRYAETDQMGVAHHAAYIPWLEEARIAAMKAIGVSYRELERCGIMMPVIDLNIQYKRGLQFDDAVTVQTELAVLGPSRLAFQYRVLGPGQRLHAEARVVVAACSTDGGRPTRLPPELLAVLQEACVHAHHR